MIRIALLVTLGLSPSVFAFTPPLMPVLKDLFDVRKPALGTEIVLKHRVLVNQGEWVELEERLVRERGQMKFLWRFPSELGQPIAASLENHIYVVTKERTYPTRSEALVRYLTTPSAEEFRELLTKESFIKRDSVTQYKPGFIPQGDVASWNLKENYLRHDEMYQGRVNGEPALAVQGAEGDPGRTIFFDPKSRGVVKLEWKDSGQLASWTFSALTKVAGEMYLPKRMSFDYVGTERVLTELVSYRALNDKALFEFKNTWKQAQKALPAIPSNVETTLKLLLSYR